MPLKFESEFFSNRNRRLIFVRLRKNRAVEVWTELSRLVYRDVAQRRKASHLT